MPKRVNCLVEACVFNAHHDCSADAIEVQPSGNDIVGTSKGTQCATFMYRDFDDGSVHHQPGAHTE
jgi:hypothetical protein